MARKQMIGTVVSDKSQKTIVVQVNRHHRHPLYSKSYTVSKKWSVHDEKGEAHIGDRVRIVETRPISKTKSWQLAEVLERAVGQVEEVPEVNEKVEEKDA